MVYGKAIVTEHAGIASEQPLASLAGYDVMRRGGNAFDAAVATSLTLAVTFHPAGGIGGDFFGMFYEAKTGRVQCLMASGWSPSGLVAGTLQSLPGGKVPLYGPLSCTVPGYLLGVCEMHSKLGSSEFRSLAAPAVDYALKGFPAGQEICASTAAAFADLPDAARRIFGPTGKPPTPGDFIRQPELGRVLSDVAEGGPDAFYDGWPAEEIRDTLVRLGVPTDISDFEDLESEWVAPLTLDYRGTMVYEMPPSTMGATSLLILKILSQLPMQETGSLSKDRVESTMNAAVAAYQRRDEMLGDPRFTRIDMDAFLRVSPPEANRTPRISGGDTTAFSVVDGAGNLVSGIQSLFHHFGSRVFVPKCGIFLNNRGSGFGSQGPNAPGPRKRPLHTLSSMLLERDGRPYMAIGTSGGDHRPLQHALFVTNAVDYRMPLEQVVAHPRFLWGGGDALLAEDGYERGEVPGFKTQWLPMPGKTGVCQAVEVSGASKKAVCDLRGAGIPAGF